MGLYFIMKKQYFSLLAFVLMMLVGVTSNLNAQVTGMPTGYLTDFPTISTAGSPVWYNMMTSNYGTTADRSNRFMYWDGTTLGSEKIDAGITSANQQDKYLWRLEQGPTTSTATAKYVYLVNKLDGKRVSATVVNATTGAITTADQGLELKLATSQSAKDEGKFTAEIPVAGQFYLQNEPSATTSVLNIGATDKGYSIILFNAWPSVTKASGWFFYPAATLTSTNVVMDNESLLNVYPNPFNTELQINSGLKNLDKVEIFNVQGIKVASELVNPYKVNTSALVPGLYMVKAYANGNVYTQKLFKSVSK